MNGEGEEGKGEGEGRPPIGIKMGRRRRRRRMRRGEVDCQGQEWKGSRGGEGFQKNIDFLTSRFISERRDGLERERGRGEENSGSNNGINRL